MARITVEDCLEKVENKFALSVIAAYRVRELCAGSPPAVKCKNKEVVTALREIAEGFVDPARIREIIISGLQSKRSVMDEDPADQANDEYEKTLESMMAESGYDEAMLASAGSTASEDEADIDHELDEEIHEVDESEEVDELSIVYEDEDEKQD